MRCLLLRGLSLGSESRRAQAKDEELAALRETLKELRELHGRLFAAAHAQQPPASVRVSPATAVRLAEQPTPEAAKAARAAAARAAYELALVTQHATPVRAAAR